MKLILVVVTALLAFWFFVFFTSETYPSLYKDVKITDYLSSTFTILSFLVAFFAYRYAKDYIKQERHKNASTFAIDILHKDMVLLSSLEEQDFLLYMLSQRMIFYIHSTGKDSDHFCVKHMANIYQKLQPKIASMKINIEILQNDIFKARIVGCTIRDEQNDIYKLLEDYTTLMSKLNRLTVMLASFLTPYYGYDYNNIKPETDILIYFPGGTDERTESLKDVNELYLESDKLIKSIFDRFKALREGNHDLNEVFKFD